MSTTTTRVLAMSTVLKTRAVGLTPGICNGFQLYSQPAESGSREQDREERPQYEPRTGLQPSHTLPHIIRCWGSRLTRKPTVSAGTVTVTALPSSQA